MNDERKCEEKKKKKKERKNRKPMEGRHIYPWTYRCCAKYKSYGIMLELYELNGEMPFSYDILPKTNWLVNNTKRYLPRSILCYL